jgi:hypothetical protein
MSPGNFYALNDFPKKVGDESMHAFFFFFAYSSIDEYVGSRWSI